jgi:hypothetical protein
MTTIYGLLITDISHLNYDRIPAVLFGTIYERENYIQIWAPQSYRLFQYEIEDEYVDLDLREGAPRSYPNL